MDELDLDVGGIQDTPGPGGPGGGKEGTTPPNPAPAATPPAGQEGSTVSAADVAAQAAAGTPTTAAPAAGTPAAPAAGAAAATPPQEWESARQYAASLGLDTTQFQDDFAFLKNVVDGQRLAAQQMSQLQQLAQYGQMYIQQLSQQPAGGTQPAAAAAPAKPKLFDAPAFDRRWLPLIERTENGGYKVKDGADPTILPKFLAYDQYRRDFADKLMSDPEGTLSPFVQQVAESRARELIKSELAVHADQQQATQFIRDNQSWLFTYDAQGQAIYNPQTGKPVVSPAGRRFHEHLRQAEAIGITNTAGQENYAKQMLRADYVQSELAQLKQGAAGDQAKRNLLQTANRAPSRAGSVVGTDPAGGRGAPQNQQLSLKEQLEANLKANGITDADITGEGV